MNPKLTFTFFRWVETTKQTYIFWAKTDPMINFDFPSLIHVRRDDFNGAMGVCVCFFRFRKFFVLQFFPHFFVTVVAQFFLHPKIRTFAPCDRKINRTATS